MGAREGGNFKGSRNFKGEVVYSQTKHSHTGLANMILCGGNYDWVHMA